LFVLFWHGQPRVSASASIHHRPQDRLRAILEPSSLKPGDEEPFAELDSFYEQILHSEKRDAILMQRILMAIAQTTDKLGRHCTPAMIAQLLSPVSIGDVYLILEKLRSVISWGGPDEPMIFWHASMSDYLLHEARSKNVIADRQIVHEAIARGYLRLSRSQGPDLFLKPNSDVFWSFLEHYTRACFSPNLREDLVAFDLFSAHKAAVGEPIDLRKLRDAWESERVQNLFRTLVCPQFSLKSEA
jgi:hypothetical protein